MMALFGRSRTAAPVSRVEDFGFAELRAGGSRVVIVPALGGKIAQMELGGREWLWMNDVMPYATPDEDLDRSELRRDLDWALNRLADSLREAFVMKHVEGRSYEEMADLLGTTVGALKMRVHRAREALQALLEEKYA